MGSCTNGSKCQFSHETGGSVCEFYLVGKCRFGNYCQLKHVKPKQLGNVARKPIAKAESSVWSQVKVVSKFDKSSKSLCPAHINGHCTATECSKLHGLQCPGCLRNHINPETPKHINEAEIDKCISEKEMESKSKLIECVVCLEIVSEKKDPRFGLLSCDHQVCLECVRKWRNTDGNDTSKVMAK
jgi:E3 ubiquitin-protein ligase makorin